MVADRHRVGSKCGGWKIGGLMRQISFRGVQLCKFSKEGSAQSGLSDWWLSPWGFRLSVTSDVGQFHLQASLGISLGSWPRKQVAPFRG